MQSLPPEPILGIRQAGSCAQNTVDPSATRLSPYQTLYRPGLCNGRHRHRTRDILLTLALVRYWQADGSARVRTAIIETPVSKWVVGRPATRHIDAYMWIPVVARASGLNCFEYLVNGKADRFRLRRILFESLKERGDMDLRRGGYDHAFRAPAHFSDCLLITGAAS